MAGPFPGAQLAQPPVTLLNTANAISQKYFEPYLADNIFKPSPTYWRLVRKGLKRDGAANVWPGITQEEMTGGAYWGAMTLDTTAVDSLQPFEVQWRGYQQAIVIPVLDHILNSGPRGSVSLVRAKCEVAMGSLLQKLNRAVYGVAPQNTAIDLDGFPVALAASGTYAGVPLGGFWFSNGGNGPLNVGGSLTTSNLNSQYINASFGNEEPTAIFTTDAGWSVLWATIQQLQRYDRDEETERIGFRNFMFNRAAVMRDKFVPAGTLYGITEKYVQVIVHPMDYFRVDPFLQPTNQRVIISHIFVLMNLRFLTLRQHFAMTGLTNA